MAAILKTINSRDVLVDESDMEMLAAYRWRFVGRYIASTKRGASKETTLLLHRVIMNAPKGVEVDHINGNPFDNRRCNLRFATRMQNEQNARKISKPCTSRYKGIYWNKRKKRWHAQIRVNRVRVHLGMFKDEEVAARKYDEAARRYFGEYARCNFED